MIKVETKDGVTRISLSGSIGDLVADTIVMIRAIYLQLKEIDEEKGTLNACVYREGMNQLISKSFIDFPPEFTVTETNVKKKDDLSIWFDD